MANPSYQYSIQGQIETPGQIASAVPAQFYTEGQVWYNNEAPFVSSMEIVLGSASAAYFTGTTGGAAAGFVGVGEQINTTTEFSNDNVIGLSLNRAILRTAIALSETDLAQCRTYDPAIVSQLIRNRLKEAWYGNLSAALRFLEVQCFVGQGTATSIASGATVNGIFGLTYLLHQSQVSGTYGGQSLATYPLLKLNYLNVNGAITTALMDEGFSTIENIAGSVISSEYRMICSPNTEAALKQTADDNTNPAVRFNADSQPASYMLGARKVPSAKVSRISYNSVPVFSNSAMYAAGLDGYLFLYNPRDINMDTLPYLPLNMTVDEHNESLVERFGRVTSEIGLPLLYQPYANLGAVYAAYAATEIQLVFKAPNRAFLWYGITVS